MSGPLSEVGGEGLGNCLWEGKGAVRVSRLEALGVAQWLVLEAVAGSASRLSTPWASWLFCW